MKVLRNAASLTAFLAACLNLLAVPPTLAEPTDAEREALWAEVDGQIEMLAGQLGIEGLSPGVRDALWRVPRHLFVPSSQQAHAYENRPLPIGHGQTISQPLIVAAMTELLGVAPGDRVFELGTGSGYQAAVLAELGVQVFSVEIVEPLGRQARVTLDRLGYQDVATRISDGYDGWPDEAPFDAIIVTAASDHIPPPLIRQLKPGGRLLIPVGNRYQTQKLVLLSRSPQGQVTTRELLPVTFVPLTGHR
jgi:protein-L-isoaspartate(D-aspartate) O-methyltransferase